MNMKTKRLPRSTTHQEKEIKRTTQIHNKDLDSEMLWLFKFSYAIVLYRHYIAYLTILKTKLYISKLYKKQLSLISLSVKFFYTTAVL